MEVVTVWNVGYRRQDHEHPRGLYRGQVGDRRGHGSEGAEHVPDYRGLGSWGELLADGVNEGHSDEAHAEGREVQSRERDGVGVLGQEVNILPTYVY